MRFVPKNPYFPELLSEDKQKLLDFYKSEGYLSVELAQEIEEQDDQIWITYRFLTKPSPAKMGAFFIDGNWKTSNEAILFQLDRTSLRPNGFLIPRQLEDGLARIRKRNLFSKVKLEYIEQNKDEYDLKLLVSEKPSIFFRYSSPL